VKLGLEVGLLCVVFNPWLQLHINCVAWWVVVVGLQTSRHTMRKVANCQNCGQGTLSPALIEVSHIPCEIHHQVETLAQAQQTRTTIHLDVNNAKV
jgi:hypothetical protein